MLYVMIVLSCQSFKPLNDPNSEGHNTNMANPGRPDEDRRIVLVRPHTVLLLSTVAGESAVRGSYAGALARRFRLADGKTDIHQMHCAAVQAMSQSNPHQTPEHRCTLKRGELVFPKSDALGTAEGTG